MQAQAISYTTGVPAVIGAEMMLTGKWRGKGVFNMEQFDPDPFLDVIEPARPALAGRASSMRRWTEPAVAPACD